MRLLELLQEDPYYGTPVKKYWFNAVTGNEIPISSTTHHSKFVVEHPKLFGLTRNQVDIIYDKDKDYSEDVLSLAFQHHWVRVTHSTSQEYVWITGDNLKDMQSAAKVYTFDLTRELYLSNGQVPISKRIVAKLIGPQINTFVKTGKLPDEF